MSSFSDAEALSLLELLGGRFGLVVYPLCGGLTKDGVACQASPMLGKDFCVAHKSGDRVNVNRSFCLKPLVHGLNGVSSKSEYRCSAVRENGVRCGNAADVHTDSSEHHLCAFHTHSTNVLESDNAKMDKCIAQTLAGHQCKNAKKDGDLCTVHAKKSRESNGESNGASNVDQQPVSDGKCTAITKAGSQCKMSGGYTNSSGQRYCKRHLGTS